MAGQNILTDLLSSVPIFSELGKKQLRSIANTGKEISYEGGETIVKEGERGVGFYLVEDGQVEVRRKSKVLARMGKGDFFGEMSLLDEQPRSADVVTTRPTKCFALSSWSFFGLVKSNPNIAINLMKELTRRLRETDKAFTE